MSIRSEHRKMAAVARDGWDAFAAKRRARALDDLVVPKWSVTYDKLGHDMIVEARVNVAKQADSLLQVWLTVQHPGIWIPELRPWVSSVVEFDPAEKRKSAHVGLFDSKWRPEDAGQTYNAALWGYALRGGKAQPFHYEQSFVYPG